MAVEFGVRLPPREAVMSGRPETAPMLAMAERAEAAGFDSVWIGDSLIARPRHEPLTLLAAVAARTRRGGARPGGGPAAARGPGGRPRGGAPASAPGAGPSRWRTARWRRSRPARAARPSGSAAAVPARFATPRSST